MYLAVKGDKKSMFFSNVVNSDPKPWLWKNEPSKALKNTHSGYVSCHLAQSRCNIRVKAEQTIARESISA